MNKQKFIELVEDPANIREKDSDILAELARNYPDASLVHIMLAKAYRNTDLARHSLASAALYIPDRSVLKLVMEDELLPLSSAGNSKLSEPGSSPIGENKQNSEGKPAKQEVIKDQSIPEQEMAERRDVFGELQENLQKLKDQREKFERPAEPGQLREEEDILRKRNDLEVPPPASGEIEKPYRLPERLQEIVESIEEKTINDPKRIEQINLIDNFIRNSSSISRRYRSAGEVPTEQNDLTGNGHFTPPDLVTENLAQIMVRQGKTEKAIDIYEKLVLKYPQKKAYFASCIEKLKNP